MRKIAFLLLLLASTAAWAHIPTFSRTAIPACTDGSPNLIYVRGADAFDDCSGVGAGNFEVMCKCLDGVWEAVGTGGGGGLVEADIDTSAELRAIVGDEVGTGALMFGLDPAMADGLTCSASQVVRRNAADTAFECATPGASVLDRKTSATTINSSTTETTVYTYTIAGGTLGADDALRLSLLNEFFSNTGSNRGIRVRVKLGGATVIDWDSGNNFGSNATRRLFSAVVDVSATGATNSQIVSLTMNFASATTTFGTVNTGTGTPASSNTSDLILHSGTLSNDMTSSQTLEVTYQLSFSSANLETVTYSGSLELLSPGGLSGGSFGAPYDQYDPDSPPASFGTGGWREEWTGNTPSQSWTPGNIDSSTVTISYDSVLYEGDTTPTELHVEATAAATNADQTLTASMLTLSVPVTNDSCAVGVITAGTVATPTALSWIMYGNHATDGFYFQSDTNYDNSSGVTSHGSAIVFPANVILSAIQNSLRYVQLRYTDSSRNLDAWISQDGRWWQQVGSSITLAADPLFWWYGAREGGVCRFDWIQNRTDANRNDASDD